MITLPTLLMSKGVRFSQAWQYVDAAGAPIDLSGWFGSLNFSRDGVEVLALPLDLDAEGNILLDMTDAQVGQLSGPRITFRIILTPIEPQLTEVWGGQVMVE